MNTFSENYLSLMKNNPEQKETLVKLRELYTECRGDSNKVFTLPIFLERLSLVPSPASFSALNLFEKAGLITKTLRVESPSLGGLGDYKSITEIPDVIDDFRTGCELEVKPENIKVLYSLNNEIEAFSK